MTNEIKYKVINGTSYHLETSQDVINVLESVMQHPCKRIRVYFGDVATGKCWNEEHDIFGYVGRSTGTNKIPLLIANARSYGGGALLDHCIIKIKESKGSRILYQSANFQQPKIEVKEATDNLGEYTHELFIDGELYSRHKNERAAKILQKKLS